MSASLPVPPRFLATRVGCVEGADPAEFYLREGEAVAGRIRALLPEGFDLEGKRVLDFGCGSARVLRHFVDAGAELWGCDVDAASIEWVQEHLSPPLRVFRNRFEPPLPFAAEKLDLIWATSVFTHIDNWSEWLVELHRVLAPGGLLIASFLGPEMREAILRMRLPEDSVGVLVLRHWQQGDGAGEPDVFHSEWWLREHWGRAFEVLGVAHPDTGHPTQSYIALRKRPGTPTPAELAWADPAEPRELAAAQTTALLLRTEINVLVAHRTVRSVASETARNALRHSPWLAPARSLRRRLRGDYPHAGDG
jgi:SAM-dependent methyltransferase